MRRKQPVWWPGKYEGKTAEQVADEVGIGAPSTVPFDFKTPASMRAFDAKTGALRKDGKLCKPLQG